MRKETDSAPTDVLEDEQQQQRDDPGLRAHFHRVRIASGAVAVAAVMGAMMLVLHGDGVTFDHFLAGEKTDSEIKALVDYYNSISGSLGSFVSKPVELYLGLLVPAAFLCFATDFTLDKSSIGHWQYVPLLTAAAVAYLFSNGLNALNVQVTPGELQLGIAARDLGVPLDLDAQSILPNGSLPMSWSRTYAETTRGNSVLNTILRSKIAPIENVLSSCTGNGFMEVTVPFLGMPAVAFGFPSRPWQREALSTALEPVQSLKIAMNTSASALPHDALLPSAVNITRGLVNTGIYALTSLDLAVGQFKPTSVSTADSGSFVNAAHTTWLAALSVVANASVKDATVEYTRFVIAENVTYDAVTLELPVALPQRYGLETHIANTTDGVRGMYIDDFCSREGCIVSPAEVNRSGIVSTVQPRVQVVSICLSANASGGVKYKTREPCKQSSMTAMRVVSVGSRIVGDMWDIDATDYNKQMRFTNLRTVYSITIGHLAWTTSNVALAFGASCVNRGGNCDGLRYKLQPQESTDDESSEYLVVGTANLPINELKQYTSNGEGKFVNLVMSADGLGGQRFQVLRARNFANVTASGASLRTAASHQCNTFSDDYIRAVEKNHLYMEHSLQPSYTAAFYYLFQNAVAVRRQQPAAASTSPRGDLKFTGNAQIMSVHVLVPTTSAVVALVGCVLVLAIGAGVVLRANTSEHELQARANAAIVTEAMMNSSKYPPWVLEMALEQAAAVHASRSQQENEQDVLPVAASERVVLQNMRVQSVAMHHRDEPQVAFHIGSDASNA